MESREEFDIVVEEKISEEVSIIGVWVAAPDETELLGNGASIGETTFDGEATSVETVSDEVTPMEETEFS